MVLAYWLNLHYMSDTGWSRRAIESDSFIKIVIFFGRFSIDCKIFIASLIAADDVIIMILSCAVVHVFDGRESIFFHLIF